MISSCLKGIIHIRCIMMGRESIVLLIKFEKKIVWEYMAEPIFIVRKDINLKLLNFFGISYVLV